MKAHDDQVVITLTDPEWGFDDRPPAYFVSHAGCYKREVRVDPAPAYAHDPELVRRELEHLRTVAPLPIPLAIVLLGHEVTSRTNGQFLAECAWSRKADNEPAPAVGIIILGAKRIPIHPAMTRYLVAHEYGHAVEDELKRRRGLKDGAIKAEYVEKVRPTASTSYGCGRWHANVGELFANDFRILVAEREVEFWPHAGFDRPEQNLAAVGYWAQVARELRS